MHLAHALIKRGLKHIILVFSVFLFVPPVVNSQNNSDKLTKEEARAFIQEFLWFCTYAYDTYEEPQQELFRFFPDSLQDLHGNNIDYNFQLDAAKIVDINLPYVDVVVVGRFSRQDEWQEGLRFQLSKNKGKVYLIPYYDMGWSYTILNTWQKREDIDPLPFTSVDRLMLQGNVVKYLEHRYKDLPDFPWTEENLYSTWTLDSSSHGRLPRPIRIKDQPEFWKFKPSGVFYEYFNFYDYPARDLNPARWFLYKDKLVISKGFYVGIYTVKDLTRERLHLIRPNQKSSIEMVFHKGPPQSRSRDVPDKLSEHGIDVVIPPRYDYIDYEYNAYLQPANFLGIGEKIGVINRNGELIHKTEYEEINPFGEDGTAYGRIRRKWFLLDTLGNKEDAPDYTEFDYRDTRRPVRSRRNPYFEDDAKDNIIQGSDQKFGIIDSSGKVLIYPQYDELSFYRNIGYRMRQDGKEGLLNKKGEVLLEPKFEYFQQINDSIFSVGKGRLWGLYNSNKKDLVLPIEYDNVHAPRGSFYQTKKGTKTIYWDKDIQEFQIPGFKHFIILNNWGFGVIEGRKKGLLDSTFQVVLAPEFDDIKFRDKTLLVRKNGKWGLLNIKGKEMIPIKYEELKLMSRNRYRWKEKEEEEVERLEKNYVLAKKDGKYGLLSSKGKVILPFIYENLELPREPFHGFGEYWLVFKEGGQKGFINLKGEIMIPADYNFRDYSKYFSSAGNMVLQKGNLFGMLNMQNEVVLPFIFEEIAHYEDAPFIRVRYKGLYGLIKNPDYKLNR